MKPYEYRDVNGKVVPATGNELRDLAKAGRIGPETLIRKAGGTRWNKAGNIAALSRHVAREFSIEDAKFDRMLEAIAGVDLAMQADGREKSTNSLSGGMLSASLLNCPDCTGSVSKHAAKCPHCGGLRVVAENCKRCNGIGACSYCKGKRLRTGTCPICRGRLLCQDCEGLCKSLRTRW